MCFGVSSFLAAPIVTCLGDKWSLTLGALCLGTYVGATILPLEMQENPDDKSLQKLHEVAYGLTLVGAAICGFGASILWVA